MHSIELQKPRTTGSPPYPSPALPSLRWLPIAIEQPGFWQLAGHGGGGGSGDKNSPLGGRAGVPFWEAAGPGWTQQRS